MLKNTVNLMYRAFEHTKERQQKIGLFYGLMIHINEMCDIAHMLDETKIWMNGIYE